MIRKRKASVDADALSFSVKPIEFDNYLIGLAELESDFCNINSELYIPSACYKQLKEAAQHSHLGR